MTTISNPTSQLSSAIGLCLLYFSSLLPTLASSSITELNGKPWIRHTIDNTSLGADGARLADFDHDGDLDIITGWEQGNLTRIYLNPGKGKVEQPWPLLTVGAEASPEDAIMIDLNNDLMMDAVSATEGKNNTIYVHRRSKNGETHWQTKAFQVTREKQAWMYLHPLDVDGLNNLDIITGSKNPNGAIGWLCSPDDPWALEAWTWHPLRKSGWIMSLFTVDMDDDGLLDILYSDRKTESASIGYLKNPGPQANRLKQPWPDRLIGAQNEEVMFIDHSPHTEHTRRMIAGAIKPNTIAIFIEKTEQSWTRSNLTIEANTGTSKAVKFADIDRDGQIDLVYSCEHARNHRSGLIWLKKTSDQTWTAYDISGRPGVKFDLIQTLDLDQDGDLDVITCEEVENLGLIWYENPLGSP